MEYIHQLDGFGGILVLGEFGELGSIYKINKAHIYLP
jgi:hypothetical protein